MSKNFVILGILTLSCLAFSQAQSKDVMLDTPFIPLPTHISKTSSSTLAKLETPHSKYITALHSRRAKDEQLLTKKGLSTHTARLAIWAIAHKPQSNCAIYAMHLAGYHEMKFVRPDLFKKFASNDVDNALVKEITDKHLCERKNLNIKLSSPPPYVHANSLASLFKKQDKKAVALLRHAGVTQKNAEEAAWVVSHHPNSSCAWQVERILADEKEGYHNSDDEKDAVFKIEHNNECAKIYYK
ncbi:hypothetical protein GT348_04120 [Aristophania vespae]|uniref:Uncharacterized protein n=1 Tax=Aristophania vespae TaxID=2697033 RepID=A0A6P1NL14_9PROT|nr:hypothetical protein [Aristophania vespae]QHI95561.1 hypothetical protein GT348_04120 [Aristophania vespae]